MQRMLVSTLLAALCLAAPIQAAEPESPAPPEPTTKLVEIYHVAPGKHEAFLRAIAQLDEANRRAGVAPRQLYVHSDGASWDFILIQDADFPEGKGELVGRAYRSLHLPTGPRFFTEFRKLILEHTDTFATGPTTAADYLARLDATPPGEFEGGPDANYQLGTVIPLGGTPRWDYLALDDAGRRVYVAHDAAVDVVDLDTRSVTGHLSGLAGAHGVALAPALDRVFVASSDRGTVTAFRRSTGVAVDEARVGEEPDSVTYEPVSGRLFVWNAGSRDVTVLEAATLESVATVKLDGAPEFAVADGRGAVFVNLEDTAEIVRIDAGRAAITARYPLAPCQEPTGLAVDRAAHRLYSACGNQLLAVIDADHGDVLQTAPIGHGADAVVVDTPRSRVLVSNGEGFVSVFDASRGCPLPPPVTVQTRATGRTMAVDPESGAFFVPAVDLDLDWGRRQASFAPGGLKLYVFDPSVR